MISRDETASRQRVNQSAAKQAIIKVTTRNDIARSRKYPSINAAKKRVSPPVNLNSFMSLMDENYCTICLSHGNHFPIHDVFNVSSLHASLKLWEFSHHCTSWLQLKALLSNHQDELSAARTQAEFGWNLGGVKTKCHTETIDNFSWSSTRTVN